MDRRDLWRGLRVFWLHKPKGGYGYEMRIPVQVAKVGAKRVMVEVECGDGTRAKRIVSVSRLREYNQYLPIVSQK